jgi:cytochrome c peroxidase
MLVHHRGKWIPLSGLALGAMVLACSVALGPATQPSESPASPDVDAADLRAAYSTDPKNWPAATWDDLVAPEARHELAPVPDVVFPEDNPYSKPKADLGKKLFWDPRLSGSMAVACVSCHHPDLGWTDGKTTSQGHQLVELDRNSPTILGVALQPKLMWDGSADSLEDQAVLPLANSKEMHVEFSQVEQTLNAIPEYVAEFKSVFGVEAISMKEITYALATFQRTIMPGKSRFDQFLAGRHNVLDDQEIRGLHLFRTKARCINCHNGPLLSDGLFHNDGLTYYKRAFEDLGLYNVTKKPEDVGLFRTPTLRNITRTGPYMHNGLFELDVLITLYNSGMPDERAPAGDPLAPKKSPLLRELMLTPGERKDLQAFMNTLEEPRTRVRAPKLPGLYTEIEPADQAP